MIQSSLSPPIQNIFAPKPVPVVPKTQKQTKTNKNSALHRPGRVDKIHTYMHRDKNNRVLAQSDLHRPRNASNEPPPPPPPLYIVSPLPLFLCPQLEAKNQAVPFWRLPPMRGLGLTLLFAVVPFISPPPSSSSLMPLGRRRLLVMLGLVLALAPWLPLRLEPC